MNNHSETTSSINKSVNELVLKIRIANDSDPDFIETELDVNNLTYCGLIELCCKELDLIPDQIIKLRKLPNTKLRNDKDIRRLECFQEIEVVLDSPDMNQLLNLNGTPKTVSTIQTNAYQSISHRDQIVLY